MNCWKVDCMKGKCHFGSLICKLQTVRTPLEYAVGKKWRETNTFTVGEHEIMDGW